MIKKCFVLTQFGSPHSWTQEFIDNVQFLEQYGFYWKIFTPNNFASKGNVEIVPMSVEEFNLLVQDKLGVKPNLYITPKGIPSVHVTDYYIFTGAIFEDYLKDFDFWGITNLDVVYGRLDHFVPDSLLEDCDLFTDDVNAINGVFSLWRNIPKVNRLFERITIWKEVIVQPNCPGCTGLGEHKLYVSDEHQMTEVMKDPKDIRYKYPPYFPLHSYDRLEQHIPFPKLLRKGDGALCEMFSDLAQPGFRYGREIMYFHFNSTKEWPNIAS